MNEDRDSSKTVEQPPKFSFDKSRVFKVRSIQYFIPP